jgi:mannitol-1-phosphate 5-dehydrogenase
MFIAGAHAIGAYAGHRHGYEVYSQAMSDPAVRAALEGAVAAMSAALQKMHGFSQAEMKRYLDPLVARFCDARFADPIARVARDPRRKLAPHERLVRPARYLIEQSLPCDHLAQGIADALRYDHPDDQEAQQLQASLREKGFERTLQEVAGIRADEALGRRLQECWKESSDESRRR